MPARPPRAGSVRQPAHPGGRYSLPDFPQAVVVAPGRRTLAVVFRTAPQYKMRPVDVAAEVNRRGLYRMRDIGPLETQQVHARAGNNLEMFERGDGFIKLRQSWRTRN